MTWSSPAPMPSTMPEQDNSMASLSRLALARLGRGAVLTPDTLSLIGSQKRSATPDQPKAFGSET